VHRVMAIRARETQETGYTPRCSTFDITLVLRRDMAGCAIPPSPGFLESRIIAALADVAAEFEEVRLRAPGHGDPCEGDARKKGTRGRVIRPDVQHSTLHSSSAAIWLGVRSRHLRGRIAQKDLRAMCAFVQYREELPPISQREVVEKLTRTSSRVCRSEARARPRAHEVGLYAQMFNIRHYTRPPPRYAQCVRLFSIVRSSPPLANEKSLKSLRGPLRGIGLFNDFSLANGGELLTILNKRTHCAQVFLCDPPLPF
jgi:hypothetical protein